MRMRKGLAKIIFSLVFDGIYKVFSYFCHGLAQKKTNKRTSKEPHNLIARLVYETLRSEGAEEPHNLIT